MDETRPSQHTRPSLTTTPIKQNTGLPPRVPAPCVHILGKRNVRVIIHVYLCVYSGRQTHTSPNAPNRHPHVPTQTHKCTHNLNLIKPCSARPETKEVSSLSVEPVDDLSVGAYGLGLGADGSMSRLIDTCVYNETGWTAPLHHCIFIIS